MRSTAGQMEPIPFHNQQGDGSYYAAQQPAANSWDSGGWDGGQTSSSLWRARGTQCVCARGIAVAVDALGS